MLFISSLCVSFDGFFGSKCDPVSLVVFTILSWPLSFLSDLSGIDRVVRSEALISLSSLSTFLPAVFWLYVLVCTLVGATMAIWRGRIVEFTASILFPFSLAFALTVILLLHEPHWSNIFVVSVITYPLLVFTYRRYLRNISNPTKALLGILVVLSTVLGAALASNAGILFGVRF